MKILLSTTLLSSCSLAVALAVSSPVLAQSAPAAKKEQAAQANGFTSTDKKLIETAAESDETEMSMAKIALSKSGNADVKRYAEMMIREHTHSTSQLKPIARAAGVPEPPISSKHQAVANQLNGLSGAAFDQAYVKANVVSHQETLGKMKTAAPLVTNPQLKAFAQETTPVVEHHLSMARSLESKLGTKAG